MYHNGLPNLLFLPLTWVLCVLGPGQVREVRIFTFRPNTDPSVVTGLVIWNGLDIVDRYQVDVAENGVLLPNVSEH